MNYEIKLHTLTPVHIGCDDSYTPVEFIIDTDRNTLIQFDLFEFIENLSPEEWQEFNSIASNPSPIALVHIYRFYSKMKGKIKGRELPIPNELSKRYTEVKQLKNDRDMLKGFNEFEIPRTFYNPYTLEPIVPGSSIKGSLRTAFVEALIKEHDRNRLERKEYNQIEEELLGGKMQKDPFRLLKISDFEPESSVKTKILYQINVRKERETSRESLSIPIEVIPEGALFRGTIKIESPIEGSGIRKSIEFKDLLLKSHSHYAKIFNKEIDLRKIKNFKLPNITQFRDGLKEKYFILRIGKHSGAEAVTWEGLRKIRVRTREGIQRRSESTTIWLASREKKPKSFINAMPFGWVMLEVC